MTRKSLTQSNSHSNEQTRIVVRKEALMRAQEILGSTKIATLTELINVLIFRYGNHLERTWKLPVESSFSDLFVDKSS